MKFASIILPLLAGYTAAFGPSSLPVANRPSTRLNEQFEVCIASGPGEGYNGNLEVTLSDFNDKHTENLNVDISPSAVGVHTYDTGDHPHFKPMKVSIKPTGGGTFTCGGVYATNLEDGGFSYFDDINGAEIGEGQTKELTLKHNHSNLVNVGRFWCTKVDLSIETGRDGIEDLYVKLVNDEGNATPVQKIGNIPPNSYKSFSIDTPFRDGFATGIDKLLLFKTPSSKPSELYHLSTSDDSKNPKRADFFLDHPLNDKEGNWILTYNIHNSNYF